MKCAASVQRPAASATRGQAQAQASVPQPQAAKQQSSTRRSLLASVGVLAGLSMVRDASAAEPFLKSVGLRNGFEEEEELLLNLREQKEGEALRELAAKKEAFEAEAAASQAGKLCATPFGVDVVGITELLFLIGATTSGIVARQRKEEVERLNAQLRQVNMSLRQQARTGAIYAPGLTPAIAAALPPPPVPIKPPVPQSAATASLMSMDESDMNEEQTECRDALKTGKKHLKAGDGASAQQSFEKALVLTRVLGDLTQQRRAVRGLAAACRLQGQHMQAIEYLVKVLAISAEMKEFTGDADAYGTIADCYTDLGDLDKAGKMYDQYIELMNRDDVVV